MTSVPSQRASSRRKPNNVRLSSPKDLAELEAMESLVCRSCSDQMQKARLGDRPMIRQTDIRKSGDRKQFHVVCYEMCPAIRLTRGARKPQSPLVARHSGIALFWISFQRGAQVDTLIPFESHQI